jgi:integrase
MKGSWWADFRWQKERIRRKSPVNTKRGAEEYERKARQQLLDGTFEKEEEEPEKPTTLAEFATEFVSNYARSNNKPSEVASKEMILKRHLVPAMGTLTLAEIDGRVIERYKAGKLKAKLEPKTINNHLTVLRKMLSLAAEWRLIPHVPKVVWMKAPKPDFDFLDFEEAERLVAGADGEWTAMITVALKTGLRLGELLALRWEDCDLIAGKLMVKRAVARGIVGTPKSGKPREVPLSSEALKALKGQRHLRGQLVFCDLDGKMLDKGECKWPLWRAAKKAGLRRIGWHVLRHTFASHLAMRGVPLKAVQELLGHATIEMTMRYAHLAPAVRREAVETLDLPANFGHQMGTKPPEQQKSPLVSDEGA